MHEDKLEQRIRFVAKHYRKGAIDTDRAWKQWSKRERIKQPPLLLLHWQKIDAVILVCAGISTWYLMTKERENWLTVTTEAGQQKKVYLPDSSMVTMDGNSAIKYDLIAFKKGSRDVEMKGRVFFQVKKKEDSPFSVSTRHTIVTVLGTRFQLYEKETETDLYVNTGKVLFAVKEKDEKKILTAGMSARYVDGENEKIQSTENSENILSWHTKKLHFNNTPLEEVIHDLCEYYQVVIVNRTENEDKHLTASFNHLSLEETLLIINQTLDVHLVVKPD